MSGACRHCWPSKKETRRAYLGLTVLKARSQAPSRGSQNSSCLLHFSRVVRVLSSSKHDKKSTRSQEGASQSCSTGNAPCRNAPELPLSSTESVPASQLPSAHLCTLRGQGKKGSPGSRYCLFWKNSRTQWGLFTFCIILQRLKHQDSWSTAPSQSIYSKVALASLSTQPVSLP